MAEMKRVLGDVQAKPDYLVVFLSLGFSLFCLGGWYSTHQKLSTVNKELDVMRRTLRVKVVGEELRDSQILKSPNLSHLLSSLERMALWGGGIISSRVPNASATVPWLKSSALPQVWGRHSDGLF